MEESTITMSFWNIAQFSLIEAVLPFISYPLDGEREASANDI
jgi:hypothetical protein